MRSELKKVVWPDGKTTAKNTGTVLLCSVAVGACIWIFDGVAVLLIKTLIGRVHRLRKCGMAENAKWYVIHTYSGYENAVKAAIEKRSRTAASRIWCSRRRFRWRQSPR